MKKKITVKKVLLTILGLVAGGLMLLFAVHRILLVKERELLEAHGLYAPVSVGDYALNVVTYGAEEPRHTIVGLAGLGTHHTSLTFRGITDQLADENRIVLIDRAGYGASDDTSVEQTAEQIVGDYRTALQNAGIPAPYVLMPHSIGSFYATYWVSTYPEEIEGIVYLDGTAINDVEKTFDEEYYDPVTNTIGEWAFKLGFQRLVLTTFDKSVFTFTEEKDRELDKALTWKNAMSAALNSETKLMNRNGRFVYDHIVTTDVPKVYITASAGMTTREEYRDYMDFMHEHSLRTGIPFPIPELTDEYVDGQLALIAEYREGIIEPFIEHIGNCELVSVPATHMVYCDRPDRCAEAVQALLDRIDAEK